MGPYKGRLISVGDGGKDVQYSDDSGETWTLVPDVPRGAWRSIIECRTGAYAGRLITCAYRDDGTGTLTMTSDPTNYLVAI